MNKPLQTKLPGYVTNYGSEIGETSEIRGRISRQTLRYSEIIAPLGEKLFSGRVLVLPRRFSFLCSFDGSVYDDIFNAHKFTRFSVLNEPPRPLIHTFLSINDACFKRVYDIQRLPLFNRQVANEIENT